MSSTAPASPPQQRVMRLLLIGAVAQITFAAFENLAVTTVMPVVAKDLDGLALYALAMGAPLACHIAATAIGGIWSDARSVRWPLLTGNLLFTSGLLLAGFAPSMAFVALGRGIAGLGTGLLIVASYVAVGALVPAPKRSLFFAAFSGAWVVPSLIGPAFAGWLVTHLSWRWIFAGFAPLVVASLLFLLPLLPLTDRAAAEREVDTAAIRRRTRVTLLPALGVASAVAILQWASSAGQDGLFPALGAATVIAVLIPLLLPKGTFRFRKGIGAVVGTRLYAHAGFIGMEAFLPLYLQLKRGMSPLESGLVLSVGAITWAGGAFLLSRESPLLARLRTARVGAGFVVVGIASATAIVVPALPVAIPIISWGLAGFGMGIIHTSMSVLALSLTAPSNHGEISAELQIADGSGSALALAMFGAVLATFGAGNTSFLIGFAAMALLTMLGATGSLRVPNLTGEPRSGSSERTDKPLG